MLTREGAEVFSWDLHEAWYAKVFWGGNTNGSGHFGHKSRFGCFTGGFRGCEFEPQVNVANFYLTLLVFFKQYIH